MKGPERDFLGPQVIRAIEKIEQDAADVDKVIGFRSHDEPFPLNTKIIEQINALSDKKN